ncbi:hypothetical protein CB1_001441001 [Camelus ferus]|nr:hypothetical protein CB1_002192009 [Camelus ferus]EPY76297.1 hypothetical protein CB1_001441001 [Camelus ferus]
MDLLRSARNPLEQGHRVQCGDAYPSVPSTEGLISGHVAGHPTSHFHRSCADSIGPVIPKSLAWARRLPGSTCGADSVPQNVGQQGGDTASWENPERTFDLVLKVKCHASENEGVLGHVAEENSSRIELEVSARVTQCSPREGNRCDVFYNSRALLLPCRRCAGVIMPPCDAQRVPVFSVLNLVFVTLTCANTGFEVCKDECLFGSLVDFQRVSSMWTMLSNYLLNVVPCY